MDNNLHLELAESIGFALHTYIDKLEEENIAMQHKIDYNKVYCEMVDSCRKVHPDINYNLIFAHPKSDIIEISTYEDKIEANNETIEKLNQLFPQMQIVRNKQN